jgi:hypothetical protein
LRAASRSDSAAAARSRSIPTGAYNQQRVSIRQHTSAYVSIAYVSIRQHTSATMSRAKPKILSCLLKEAKICLHYLHHPLSPISHLPRSTWCE